MTKTITGVDPGLRDSAVVHLIFGPSGLKVEHAVFHADDNEAALEPGHARDIARYASLFSPHSVVFVEAYTNRGNSYGEDPKMRQLMAQLKSELKQGWVIDNMGVKQVVREPLMRLLGCWNFGTPTHHQDLRSAARIAILGALRDPDLNRIIYDYVTKELDK